MSEQGASDRDAAQALPKAKQTRLGLYVTAREAHAMWAAEPDNVKILDVRTPEEYVFVGHPDMALNIPLFFPKYEWHADRRRYSVEPNVDFLADAQELLGPDDTILAMCRSGGRSAWAANLLAEAGFANVYTITDGMEGDKVKDPDSVFDGKRMKNGWINAGLPWTYDLDPDLAWHPHQDDLEDVQKTLDL